MTYGQVISALRKIRKDLMSAGKGFAWLKTIDKVEFMKKLNSTIEELDALMIEVSQGEITGRKKKEKKEEEEIIKE